MFSEGIVNGATGISKLSYSLTEISLFPVSRPPFWIISISQSRLLSRDVASTVIELCLRKNRFSRWNFEAISFLTWDVSFSGFTAAIWNFFHFLKFAQHRVMLSLGPLDWACPTPLMCTSKFLLYRVLRLRCPNFRFKGPHFESMKVPRHLTRSAVSLFNWAHQNVRFFAQCTLHDRLLRPRRPDRWTNSTLNLSDLCAVILLAKLA